MAEPTGKIDISRVLNNTFGVIMRHPLIYLGLSFLIIGIPNALLQTAQGSFTTGADGFAVASSYSAQGVGFIVLMLLSILLQATLIVATLNDLGGKPLSLADCFAKALKKLLPLIGLGIVVALGVGLGMMLLVVPGVILYLMWIVATPVMMAEDRGVIDSLKRSAELTSGSKGMIFVLLIIFFVLAVVFGLFVAFIGSLSTILLAIITLVSNTVTGAIQGAGVASIYVDLRTAKEGTDTSTLAEIFA
ncbi:DUF7544 domain-containing protein [Sphingorhabdus sp. 109]|jgi:uncharacterized membrane protein|uniref:DUF7544 domain-containing protein n=1 Tax=Sphingorhabdus sp. 109 TaxID=2653173 RepID=UPI0012F3C737|nr:hypothetical protein [Sphingorhabdus sp. 109]VWX60422.1 conserved membrane hypothetical protein [Sphingorhabdus sp. 109]